MSLPRESWVGMKKLEVKSCVFVDWQTWAGVGEDHWYRLDSGKARKVLTNGEVGPLGHSHWETDSPSAFAPSLQLGHPFLCPTKFPVAWSSLKLLLPFLLFPNPPSLWCPFPFNKVHICAFRNIKEENKTKLHLRTVSLWKLLVFVFLSILSRFGLGLEMQGTVPGDLIRLESASNIYYLRMWALGEPFQNIWSNHAHFIRGTFEAQRGQVIIVNRYQMNIYNAEDALPGIDRFF